MSLPPNWDDPPRNAYGERAIRFFGKLPHIRGEWANRGMTLKDSWDEQPDATRWQRNLLRHVFGTVDEEDKRIIRVVYCEVPKKNGKTFIAAGVGLYMTFMDGEEGAEVYSAAFTKDQAKLAWKTAYKMVQRMPALNRRARLYDYPARHEIEYPAKNSFYKPIASDVEQAEGINPHATVFDELHTQRDSALWDNFEEAPAARRHPLLWSITTAGFDRNSVCYKQHEYTRRVNAGEVDDPTHFGVIFAADAEEDDWKSPETWQKANPNYGVSVNREFMAAKAQKAAEVPAKLNSFLRYRLNVWTRQATRWLDPDRWAHASEDIEWGEYIGARCYGGLDLGAVSDLTAWVLAFPDEDDPEVVRFRVRAWCPEARLFDDSNPYRDDYQAWAREGWLEVMPGLAMGYEDVEEQILADARTYKLVDMAVDKQFQATDLMMRLLEQDISVAGIRTTYNDMTAPCDELERRLLLEPPKVRHDGNPVLAWSIANTALKMPDDDRKRPVKDAPEAKIDPTHALLFALDRCQRHEEGPKPSVYEERELIVL